MFLKRWELLSIQIKDLYGRLGLGKKTKKESSELLQVLLQVWRERMEFKRTAERLITLMGAPKNISTLHGQIMWVT